MPATPASSARTLVPLCLASVCWAFSFGLSAPLASLWLAHAGCGATTIGLNTSLYYLGIALAAGLVPRLMRRWGYGTAALGMLASGVTVALFPWGGGLAGWHLLRLLNGVAGAMSLIPVESLVNHNAVPEQRARDFGFYAFSIALGMALGTLVGMQMDAAAPRLAFLQGGLLAVAAAAAVWGWLPPSPVPAEERHARTPLDFRRNFLSFGSAWSQGFLEGGMVALLPIFLLATGLSEAAASYLMSGIMIGVIAFQVPVAWLADRLGRTNVLVGCYAVAALGLAAVPFCSGTLGLGLWLFLVGACSGAFYPMGLAILGERLPAPSIPRANAWYLAINCVGSVVGPACTGRIMDWYGQKAMFTAGEFAVVSVLAVWLALHGLSLWRERRRAGHETEAAVAKRKAA
jgi:MFS family permease